MPRRREVPKRSILPDPKYHNTQVAKFMNVIMTSGKKSVAERIVYGAFNHVEKNGKDPFGTIFLKASQQEGYVIVEIEDDGGGIDPKVVFDSAVSKELISPSEELTELEMYQLLFLPGFTTTTEVSDVSGRGVGMDSVKRDIEALLGTIEIHSTLGKGTNVRLKLPLTLAIIEGMMIAFDEYGFKGHGESEAVDKFFKKKKIKLRSFNWANSPSSYIIKE